MDSDERKAISDYISANGIEMQSFFPTLGMKGKKLEGPKPADYGWGGKLARGVINALNTGVGELTSLGIDRPTANLLFKKRAEVILGITTGNWDKVSIPKKAEFWAKMLSSIAVRQSDSIDKNVSTDVHKLLRLPGTIHGDTGLIAKRLKSVIRPLQVRSHVRGGRLRQGNPEGKDRQLPQVRDRRAELRPFLERRTASWIPPPRSTSYSNVPLFWL
jgi:DNA primase catalytic subunit